MRQHSSYSRKLQRFVCQLGLLLTLTIGVSSCQADKTETNTVEIAQSASTDLAMDHFNIWVSNPDQTKEALTKIGFTAVPDSISEVHKGQGTAGRYFNFLNTYLELIFVNDQNELVINNIKNPQLDFVERANFEYNGASPFSIALSVKDYDLTKIPFKKVSYRQDWMEENTFIYAARNSKLQLEEPSIFVIHPEIKAQTFEKPEDLNEISDEYSFWRDTYTHPNGAQKVTNVVITSSKIDLTSETMKAVNSLENVRVQNGKEHLMEVYFDDHIQGKSFDLRPELPLIIYL